MLIDTVLNIDCLEGMRLLPSGSIPLTLTSPPYDRLRLYGGHAFNFEAIAKELYRITMPGGVVVWIVQEQIIEGSESGTSSYQRLYFKRIGFCLHNTLTMSVLGHHLPEMNRYGRPLEYAFVLSKGKPRSINIIKDKRNSTAGEDIDPSIRQPDGRLVGSRFTGKIIQPLGARGSVWTYDRGWNKTTRDKIAYQHPALMPEKMAEDHIRSWSMPGDLVFDPMAGAGTTLKMAMLNDRRYLGMEIVAEYCEIANDRLRVAWQGHKQRLRMTGTSDGRV